ETASEELLASIQNSGYQPSSLCILYSLWKDEMGEGRIETSTIDRIIQMLYETKKSLVTEKNIFDYKMRERAQIDFSFFFPILAEDLIQWSKEILEDPEHNDEIANWACLISQLLLTTMEFVDAIVPEVINELWVRYLNELVLKLIPSIVRRGAVDDMHRVTTIWTLYNTCKYTELSWEDLACERLLWRELMCICEYQAGRCAKVAGKGLRDLAKIYDDKCEEHKQWREEKQQESDLPWLGKA
ncbi:hypothetical protein PMAYCL1PPCAC_03717, partial [Pristionchus mayeri]